MTITTEAQLKVRALRLIRDGWPLKQIALDIGLPIEHLEQLQRDYPSTATPTCPHPQCSHPQDGPGRPRRGWIQLKVAAETAQWFCSWRCVARYVKEQDA